MVLLNLGGGPKDAEDGRIVDNPVRMGNRTYGQRVFLAGTERPLIVEEQFIAWSAFESITVSSTALALTESLAEQYEYAFLTVEAAPVRYRLDGQVPTTAVGHTLEVGADLTLEGFWEVDQFRVIRTEGQSDATLRVSYGQRRDQ